MKRINTLLDNNPISDNDIENVTFMGNMYASAPDYEYLYSHLDDYLKGCMDAIVDVQKVFQGVGMLFHHITLNIYIILQDLTTPMLYNLNHQVILTI